MQLWRSFITKRPHLSRSPLGKDAPVFKGELAFKNTSASRGLTVNRTFTRTAVGLFILSAIIFLTIPLVGQAAPTVSRFTTNAKFDVNPTLTLGNYGLTITNQELTIKRSSSVIYTHLFQKGAQPAYCFYGPNSTYLLIKETRTTATEVYFDLWLVNLALKNPAKFSLQSNHFPIKVAPQLFVLLSPDNGKMVFSYFGTNLTNSKLSTLQDLTINSSGTGAVLSTAGPFTPAGPVIAETTSTGVTIRMYNTKSSKDGGEDQPLQVSPAFLDFERVTAGSPPKLMQFTIKNTTATDVNYVITFVSPSPSSAFTFSPRSGVLAGGDHVDIDVTLAPPADLASEANYSEDLRIVPNNNPDQELRVWILGTGVTPTPSPTPPSTPTPNTPTPTQATPTPTENTPTPTENTPTPTENTPTPTQATPTPTIPTSYLEIPGKLYAFVSFPSNVVPPRTGPDWARIGSFFTANAEINQMSTSQFRVNFEETVEQNRCLYLAVTETKVSQSNVTVNSAIVSSTFGAVVKYEKRVTPTTFKTVTIIKTGKLVIRLSNVGAQWLIDNARLSIDP